MDDAPSDVSDANPDAGRDGAGGPGGARRGTERDAARRGGAPSAVTRREFAVGAGATLLLPLAARLSPRTVGGAPGVVAAAAPTAAGPGPAAPDGVGLAPLQEGEEDPPGTEALVDHVEARWGDRLSEDDREQIRASVAGNLRAASALREVPLENGDEPAVAFRPHRGSDA